jgi:hypothetical protein
LLAPYNNLLDKINTIAPVMRPLQCFWLADDTEVPPRKIKKTLLIAQLVDTRRLALGLCTIVVN